MEKLFKLTASIFLVFLGFMISPVEAEETLKMAIFPRKSLEETAKAFDPLARYLSKKIDQKVELVLFKDFETFWQSLKSHQYDLVHYNQYHYIKSHQEWGYEVILMNEEAGSTKISSVIIVREDCGIKKVAGLKGKRIVFGGGRQAMQSYIGATQLLRKGGLKHGDYLEEFAVNPPNVVLSVFTKMADAGGVGEMSFHFSSVKQRVDTAQLRILARGEPLPMLPWAVKPKMNRLLADQIRMAMIQLREDKANAQILGNIEVTGFVPATDRDYDIVRQVVKEVLNEEYEGP